MRKIGVIEIKSNLTKLTIAGIENEHYVVLDEIENVVKLGEDVNKDGFLKPNRIAEVINILKGYKKLCNAKGIEDVSTVVTYAVRTAKNQKSFVDEVSAMLGFKVKVLTEEEEINSSYTACINSLDVPKGVLVCVGNENTLLAVYSRRNMLFQKNIPLGAATLANKFESLSTEEANAKIYEEFLNEIKNISEIQNLEPEFQIVGVGDNFESFGKIAKNAKRYSLDLLHGLTLNADDIQNVYNFIKGLDLDKRKKLRGISEARADVIASTCAIIKAVYDTCHLENVVISTKGITDGLLLNEANPQTIEKPIIDILGYSLEGQNIFYPIAKSNSEQVYNLSMLLFKQLRVLHKLPRTYIKSLRVASFMHDSGFRINFNCHEKNSFSVILNSEIFGLSHKELLVGAFISSSQYATDLSLVEFTKYRDILNEEDLDAIKKLAVIVRMAEALDRCHNNIIKDINCDILGDSVILKAICDEDASFEIGEAMNCSADFYRAYKKNIEIL